METIDYILPDWTLCPLFNGDYAGVSDEDCVLLDEFLTREKLGGALGCEEIGFKWGNDLSPLGGNCHRVTFPAPREPSK